MPPRNSKSKMLIISCFVLGIMFFYLGQQATRQPNILGYNPPPLILFIVLQTFCYIVGRMLLAKYFSEKKRNENRK